MYLSLLIGRDLSRCPVLGLKKKRSGSPFPAIGHGNPRFLRRQWVALLQKLD